MNTSKSTISKKHLIARAEQPAPIGGCGETGFGLIDWIGKQQITALERELGAGLGEHITAVGGEAENPLTGWTRRHQLLQQIGHRLPA